MKTFSVSRGKIIKFNLSSKWIIGWISVLYIHNPLTMMNQEQCLQCDLAFKVLTAVA